MGQSVLVKMGKRPKQFTLDVVVYEENEGRKVMRAAIGFKIVCSRNNAVVVQAQVQRLYSFHELLGILDRLQHYRLKLNLVVADFEKKNLQ
jgi:hypothetical protein